MCRCPGQLWKCRLCPILPYASSKKIANAHSWFQSLHCNDAGDKRHSLICNRWAETMVEPTGKNTYCFEPFYCLWRKIFINCQHMERHLMLVPSAFRLLAFEGSWVSFSTASQPRVESPFLRLMSIHEFFQCLENLATSKRGTPLNNKKYTFTRFSLTWDKMCIPSDFIPIGPNLVSRFSS